MEKVIIHSDFCNQFMQPVHMNIFMYLLLHSDETGTYKGTDSEIASWLGITDDEVKYIIDTILDVERSQNGVVICDLAKYILPSDDVKESINTSEEELVLTAEPQHERHKRKSRTSMPLLDAKFDESMQIFYPNVCKIKKKLTLAEYNILVNKIVEETHLPQANANELLIEVLQALNEYPKVKQYKDAYICILNWLNRQLSSKSFNIDYYRNINIMARKNERNAIKAIRLNSG